MHKQKHHSTDQNLCIPFCFSHICASGKRKACGLCPVCLNLVFGSIICHVVPGSQRSQSFVPFRRASVCDLCAPSSSSFKLNTRPLGHPQSSFDSTSVRKNYGNFTENHGARRECVFFRWDVRLWEKRMAKYTPRYTAIMFQALLLRRDYSCCEEKWLI